MYEVVSDEVETNTEQAISIILHNIYVRIMRQLEDHLPGGKFHMASDTLRGETKTCPKHNVASERIFAGLDYLKRKSPNISTFSMQGILLWTTNKTSEYLNACDQKTRDTLITKAMKNRKKVADLYQQKRKDIEQNWLKAKTTRVKAKERAIVADTVTNTENVLKTCGYICKSSCDVEKLTVGKTDTEKREALLAQIKYYKCINRGVVKGSLFYVTSGGKPSSQLASNLKEIVDKLNDDCAMWWKVLVTKMKLAPQKKVSAWN